MTAAVGAAVGGSGTGRRMVSFAGNTPILNDTNPKGDVNGVEVIGGLDFFGMSKGYGTNSGANLVGVDPTQAVGHAPTTCRSPRRRPVAVEGILDLAQSAGGARLVAVGDFTSVGTTGEPPRRGHLRLTHDRSILTTLRGERTGNLPATEPAGTQARHEQR